MNADEIGKLIKERRKMLGVDQKALGELSGVAVHTLSDIESGKGNPTLSVLNMVTHVLGMDVIVQVKNDTQR